MKTPGIKFKKNNTFEHFKRGDKMKISAGGIKRITMPKYYAIVDKKTGEAQGFADIFRQCLYFFKTLRRAKRFLICPQERKDYEVRECQIKIGKKVK